LLARSFLHASPVRWHRLLLVLKSHFAAGQHVGGSSMFWGLFGQSATMNSSAHLAGIRLLTATAVDLQTLLQDGKITSRELIEKSFEQIDTHNHSGMKLPALISAMPRDKALQQADNLDRERKAGIIRGPFHGIPIILKVKCPSSQQECQKLIWQDTINTHPDLGMPTTLGTRALENAVPAGNARIIEALFFFYPVPVVCLLTMPAAFRGIDYFGKSKSFGRCSTLG
jgi:hypothetical protein